MTRTLFLTGATGFVGHHLLPRLASLGWRLKILSRNPAHFGDLPQNTEIVPGDLNDAESYKTALAGVDTVLHLAALTGKASKAEHDRVNRQATGDLAAAGKAAGVTRFLFISSIAAGYEDKAFYPYAAAKAAAEHDLSSSGLNYTILRPTLVMGPGSPVGSSLAALAGLPVIPFPRRGKAVSVQPVDVTDLCRAIITVLEQDRFEGDILDVGGPDAVPMKELLGRIAAARSGRQPSVLGLPLRLVQWPLAALEPLLRPVLPATAGQFAVFGNSSTARANWLTDALTADMIGLDTMIQDLTGPRGTGDDGNISSPDPRKTGPEEARQEAENLGRHMTGLPVGADAAAHYIQALQAHDLETEGTRFDSVTLACARKGGLALRIADAFAGFACRRGMLRRRQVLLAAILENAHGTYQAFDAVPDKGALHAVMRLLASGSAAAVLTLFSLVFLVPVRAWLAVVSKPGRAHRR